MKLVNENDNYKNVLQVMIQKEFKMTPDYLQHSHDVEGAGYEVGVYLCLGQSIHHMNRANAVRLDTLGGGFAGIHREMEANNGKVFVLLGKSAHKTKKKAEQNACMNIIKGLKVVNGRCAADHALANAKK